MATREQTYKAQLQALGIYEPAFDPLIKELAQKERQRKRAQDEWSAKAKKKAEAEGRDPAKAKPDFGDELWDIIQDLDRMILAYRESMGLTPKSLRRLKGAASADPAQSAAAGISARLDAIAERVSRYGTPSVPRLNTGDTTSGTEPETPSQSATPGPSQSAAPTASPHLAAGAISGPVSRRPENGAAAEIPGRLDLPPAAASRNSPEGEPRTEGEPRKKGIVPIEVAAAAAAEAVRRQKGGRP